MYSAPSKAVPLDRYFKLVTAATTMHSCGSNGNKDKQPESSKFSKALSFFGLAAKVFHEEQFAHGGTPRLKSVVANSSYWCKRVGLR
jgi:hypothetical protein